LDLILYPKVLKSLKGLLDNDFKNTKKQRNS
jgi:hypothetical protein